MEFDPTINESINCNNQPFRIASSLSTMDISRRTACHEGFLQPNPFGTMAMLDGYVVVNCRTRTFGTRRFYFPPGIELMLNCFKRNLFTKKTTIAGGWTQVSNMNFGLLFLVYFNMQLADCDSDERCSGSESLLFDAVPSFAASSWWICSTRRRLFATVAWTCFVRDWADTLLHLLILHSQTFHTWFGQAQTETDRLRQIVLLDNWFLCRNCLLSVMYLWTRITHLSLRYDSNATEHTVKVMGQKWKQDHVRKCREMLWKNIREKFL